MYFFGFVGVMENTGCFVVSLCLRILDHRGIHFGEFICFTLFCRNKVLGCCSYSALRFELRKSVYGLGLSRSPEKSCRTGETLFFRLCREAEILSVGL